MAHEFLNQEERAGVLLANGFIAWGRAESSTIPGLVDFDLFTPGLISELSEYSSIVRQSRPRYLSRRDARHMLDEQLAPGTWDPETETGDYFRRQALLLNYFLDHHEAGSRIDDPEHFYGDILGMNPKPVPEEDIQERGRVAQEAFGRVGEAYNKPTDFTREGWGRFLEWGSIDPRALKEQFEEVDARLSEPLSVSFGNLRSETQEPVLIPPYDLVIATKDAYHLCWASRERRGFKLEVNDHPRNKTKWFVGKPGWGYLHEGQGHLAQTNSWMNNIIKRKINPGYGAETYPGVGQPVLESTADTLIDLRPDIQKHLKPEELFAIRLQQFEDLVLWNVALWANGILQNQPKDLKAYILDLMPHYTEEMAEKAILDRTKDLRRTLYLPSYGGVYQFLDRAQKLQRHPLNTPDGIVEGEGQADWGLEVVRELYKRPMTFPRALGMMDEKIKKKENYESWLSRRRGVRGIIPSIQRVIAGLNGSLMLNSLHGSREHSEGAA